MLFPSRLTLLFPTFIFIMLTLLFSTRSSASDTFYAKPHAPIEMHYTIKNNIKINEAVVLNIKLNNTIDTSSLSASLRTDPALKSLNLQPGYFFGVLAKYSESNINISLSADTPGLYRVYVSANIMQQNKIQSRHFVIPINIGNKNPKSQLKVQRKILPIDLTGRRIISMPGKAIHPTANN